MSKRLYGNIINRFDEGKNFTGRDIKVGDDITRYYWSDRKCYYVTKVIDQKHILVKKYHVCADHSKPGGMGHQDWLYFKTCREMNEYLNSCHIKDLQGKEIIADLDKIIEDEPEEWVFRYGKWKLLKVFDKDTWLRCLDRAKEDCKVNVEESHIQGLARYYLGLNDDDFELVTSGKIIKKYYELNGNISFGVRNYYYDWEF